MVIKSILRASFGRKSDNQVNWGDFRRTSPFSRRFGYDRLGGPVDRYYIEQFLALNRNHIRGRALEVKDNTYTARFGSDNISESEILDIDPNNKMATVIADIQNAPNIKSNSFDCIVFSQVLQFIYDYDAAMKTINRILKPGGTLLMTVPGITQIAYKQLGTTWFWSFSEASISRILTKYFDQSRVSISVYGNVQSAAAFLYGLGADELTPAELDVADPDYQVIIASMAQK